MNAWQGMDRYRKEVIQLSTYKKLNKGSVSLQYLHPTSAMKPVFNLVWLEIFLPFFTLLCRS